MYVINVAMDHGKNDVSTLLSLLTKGCAETKQKTNKKQTNKQKQKQK